MDKGSERFKSAVSATLPRQRGFDYLIVGAGFAGSVLAERLARELRQRVLIVDKRTHIGGNAYDRYDDAGVLIHPYGPHIFHTNSEHIFDYLSQFTLWRPYEHRVLASVDGQLVPIPINLDTVNKLYGLNLDSVEMEAVLRVGGRAAWTRSGRPKTWSSARSAASCTRSSFAATPASSGASIRRELDASVTARVPTRTNRDDRYFTDTFQAMPLHGYTRMFERMLDHPNIKVMLEHRLPRGRGRAALEAHDLHRPDRRVLRLPLRQAAVSQPGVSPRDRAAGAVPGGRRR